MVDLAVSQILGFFLVSHQVTTHATAPTSSTVYNGQNSSKSVPQTVHITLAPAHSLEPLVDDFIDPKNVAKVFA